MRISRLFSKWFWTCLWSDIVEFVVELLYKFKLRKRPIEPPQPEAGQSLAEIWRGIQNDAQERERQFYFYTSRRGQQAIDRMMEAELYRQRNDDVYVAPGIDEVEEIVRPVRKRAEVCKKLPPVHKITKTKKPMTDKQLLKELLKLADTKHPYSQESRYFSGKRLFKRDQENGWMRRSFRDLFLYFRPHGVSELQLMRVLGDPNNDFRGNRCPNIEQVVFFRYNGPYSMPRVRFTTYVPVDYDLRINHNKYNTYKDKYTMKYLEKLYDKIYG